MVLFVRVDRGREVKKGGGGGRNWGNDASAYVDSAAATADNNADVDGAGWGTGTSNGNADENTEVERHLFRYTVPSRAHDTLGLE